MGEDVKTMDHVVTQADIDANPTENFTLGETVQIPVADIIDETPNGETSTEEVKEETPVVETKEEETPTPEEIAPVTDVSVKAEEVVEEGKTEEVISTDDVGSLEEVITGDPSTEATTEATPDTADAANADVASPELAEAKVAFAARVETRVAMLEEAGFTFDINTNSYIWHTADINNDFVGNADDDAFLETLTNEVEKAKVELAKLDTTVGEGGPEEPTSEGDDSVDDKVVAEEKVVPAIDPQVVKNRRG